MTPIPSGCQPVNTPESKNTNPEAAAYLTQAHQALQQGAYRTAIAYADSADHVSGELADVAFMRGRVLSELHLYVRADSAYGRTLELKPDYTGAWFNRGNNAFQQGQYEQALAYYKQEEALHSSGASAIQKKWAAANQANMGQAYVELSQPDNARQAYLKAIAVDSSHAQAYAYLSQLYQSNGQLKKALQTIRKALVHASDNLDYRYELGSILLRIGNPEQAVPHLQTVVDQKPWHHQATYNLGQAFVQLGRRDTGQEYLVHADSLEQLHSAIEQARQTALNSPTQSARWVNLGEQFRRAKRQQEALKAYNMAAQMNPENLRLQANVANMSISLGDTTGAIQRYQLFLQRDPSFADGWVNLGVIYAMTGDQQAAREAWETALEHAPQHPKARAYLAQFSSNP